MKQSAMSAKRLFILLIFGIVLVVGGMGYGLYTLDGKLKNASTDYGVLIAQRDAADDHVADLANAGINDAKITSVTEQVDSIIPNKKQQQNVLADLIYKTTKQAGIKPELVTEIDFAGGGGNPDNLTSGTVKDKDFSFLRYYPINLSFGSIEYKQLLSLLNQFEQSERFFKVDQVQLTPPSESANNPTGLQAVTITLRAYIRT